jgi:glutaredoxin
VALRPACLTLCALLALGTPARAGAVESFGGTELAQLPPGLAAPDAEGKVVLYRTAWCSYCRRAAAYMRQHAIAFVERDIETSAAFKAQYTGLGGRGPVPFMVFGNRTMLGFSEAPFERMLAQYQSSLLPPEGGTLVATVLGVKVLREPQRLAAHLRLLQKGEAVTYLGEEKDGYFRVATPSGEGWVQKALLARPK